MQSSSIYTPVSPRHKSSSVLALPFSSSPPFPFATALCLSDASLRSALPHSASVRSALLIIDGRPPAEGRNLVLDGVDGVADDGKDDEEDDDDDGNDEVAGDHFEL